MNLNWLKKMAGVPLLESGVYSGKRGVDYEIVYDSPDLQAFRCLSPKGMLLLGSEKWDMWQETKKEVDTGHNPNFSTDTLKHCGVVVTRTGWNKMPKKYLIAPKIVGSRGWDENNHTMKMEDIVTPEVWEKIRKGFPIVI